jgi:metacaspase-1
MPTVNSNSYVHGNHNAPPPPPQTTQHYGLGSHGFAFQYSQCTGRRKALLIGINYFNQRGQLRGCINDVRNMSAYLVENFGYKREDMVILTDDQQNPMSQPTKQNILRAMHWLVKDARPNDSLFFHYSGESHASSTTALFSDFFLGHGGQTKDLDGDEEDGYDEVIYPVDFRQNGHITDDEMHRIMVRPLQAGVRLTAIFDSCHSGTALDLPYIYSTQGILKEPNLAKEAGQGLLGAVSAYSRGDLGGVANNIMGFFKKASTSEDAYARSMAVKTSPADVVMFSGSKDDQTSFVHPFFLRAPHPPLFPSRRFALLLTPVLEPTRLSPPRQRAPCPGPSSRPSRRTRSRAMSSCSIASATSCRPATPRSLSSLVAILSVSLPLPPGSLRRFPENI